MCVLLWAPSLLILDSTDTWQLVINTITTIVVFPAGQQGPWPPRVVFDAVGGCWAGARRWVIVVSGGVAALFAVVPPRAAIKATGARLYRQKRRSPTRLAPARRCQ
ncbi:hypothetical protein GCM10023321_11370 [Pseudonocardia eucalypti]|uniref:Uncharacterized protein n=1 Tax=Pseudonocardia eucalypti TaxID=648755 RepID=A0ABP9PLP5_9PSEU